MIFAKLDVCIPTHPKFIKAKPDGVGYWAAALAYTRGHELDGLIPFDVVGVILGVGVKAGRALAERLVECGLFDRGPTGYVVLNYSAKNETREQIEARRQSTKERVAKFRRNALSNAAGNADCNNVTRACVTPSVPGSGSGSDSLSLSGSDPEESHRPEGGVQRGKEPRGATPAPERLELPMEFVDGCKMDGLPDPRTLVDAALTNARAKGLVRVDWLAYVRQWCIRERDIRKSQPRREVPDDQRPELAEYQPPEGWGPARAGGQR